MTVYRVTSSRQAPSLASKFAALGSRMMDTPSLANEAPWNTESRRYRAHLAILAPSSRIKSKNDGEKKGAYIATILQFPSSTISYYVGIFSKTAILVVGGK